MRKRKHGKFQNLRKCNSPIFAVRLNTAKTVLVHLDSKNCQQGHEGMFFFVCIMIPLDEKYIIQNLNYEFWWKIKNINNFLLLHLVDFKYDILWYHFWRFSIPTNFYLCILIVLVIYVKCNYETIFVTAVNLDDSVTINVRRKLTNLN